MIASDRSAVRAGTGLLVVDGTDETLSRKAELSIQPGRYKARRLHDGPIALAWECYNASVEHHRGAWKWNHQSVSLFEELNDIPALRESRPEIDRFGQQPVRGALRRLDNGAPALHVMGVGEIGLSRSAVRQLRRMFDRGGEPRTLSITRQRSGAWRVCVGFGGVATRPLPASTDIGGVDRGVSVTAALPDGTLLTMPKFLAEAARSPRRTAKPTTARRTGPGTPPSSWWAATGWSWWSG